MRAKLSVIRGKLEGFRLERDGALADLVEAAQMAQAEAQAEADVAELGSRSSGWQSLSAPEASWRSAYLRNLFCLSIAFFG